MTKYVVLWSNHKQAIIVSITNGTEEILHVESKAKGGVKEEWQHCLADYYQEVIRAIQDAHEIFIFGPAEAKMQLKRAIMKVRTLAHRIAGTETADTMTQDELVARAREMCGGRGI